MTAQPLSEQAKVSRGPASTEDDVLVGRVLNGDHAAFELIMRRHNQRLYRLARSVLRNSPDAAEAVQDAYLHAYEKLAAYRGPGSFRAWLGRIVLNKALDRLRETRRVVSLDQHLSSRHDDRRRPGDGVPAERLVSELPGPERLAASSEIRRLLEHAIDELPDDFRTVFILRAVEGLTPDEVGDQLALPSATVRTRYHRARLRLRRALGERLEPIVPSTYPFAGARCDEIVASVLARLPAEGPARTPQSPQEKE